MRIEEEIKQQTFANEFQKVHINIMFTSSWLQQKFSGVLKPYGISMQQFNILRILRGMHPEPATIKVLTERMIDKMSNASRLVDKLADKGLVIRTGCDSDRRRVDVQITPTGLQVLEEASAIVQLQMLDAFNNLSESEAIQLNDLLDRLRG
jgi:DNA-binding MarR family transcriptional regulator